MLDRDVGLLDQPVDVASRERVGVAVVVIRVVCLREGDRSSQYQQTTDEERSRRAPPKPKHKVLRLLCTIRRMDGYGSPFHYVEFHRLDHSVSKKIRAGRFTGWTPGARMDEK